MLSALSGWKSVGYFLAVLALGGSLWWVKGKIDRAYQADQLETDLKNAKLDIIEIQTRASIAETDKLKLIALLQSGQDNVTISIEKAISRVKGLVRSDPACKLGPDVIRLLNGARARQDLPSTPIIPAPLPEELAPNPETGTPAP